MLFNLTLGLPSVVFAQTNKDTVVSLKQCIDFELPDQMPVKQVSPDQELIKKYSTRLAAGAAD